MNGEFIYNSGDTLELTKPNVTVPKFSLVRETDKILTTKSVDFDFNNPSIDPIELASGLVDAAQYHKSFGVSANQFGYSENVFVVGNDDNYVAFFNALIIEYSKDSILLPETDLSNMGLMLSVKRPKSVVVSYYDYTGEIKETKLEGITARIVQQCYDRVNGVDFKTRVSALVLSRTKKSMNKRIKKFVRSNMLLTKR